VGVNSTLTDLLGPKREVGAMQHCRIYDDNDKNNTNNNNNNNNNKNNNNNTTNNNNFNTYAR
jgi:hypothetical protein